MNEQAMRAAQEFFFDSSVPKSTEHAIEHLAAIITKYLPVPVSGEREELVYLAAASKVIAILSIKYPEIEWPVMAMANAIRESLVATPPAVCPKCQQAYVCEHCGEPFESPAALEENQ